MRRSIVCAVLLVSAVGCRSEVTGPEENLPASPDAASLAATGGVAGSVTGSAHLTVFAPPTPPGLALRNFAVSAQLAADGSVSGQWQIVAGSAILHGSVDCLTIAGDGRWARLSGVIEDAKATLFVPGTAFAMELIDNGDPGAGTPDVTTQVRAFQNMPVAVGRAFCEDGTVPAGSNLMPLPTEHGNFTIRVEG